MTDRLVNKMIKTGSLVLNKEQLLWHYCIIGCFLIPPMMNLVDTYKYYVTHTYKGVMTIGEMATWSYLPLIPAIAFYYIRKTRLKFKIINVTLDSDTFIEAAKATSKQLNWNIVDQKDNLIVAKSGFRWRSWGELITIIRDEDRILVNSICDPDNMISLASWGLNRINFKTFEQHVRRKSA